MGRRCLSSASASPVNEVAIWTMRFVSVFCLSMVVVSVIHSIAGGISKNSCRRLLNANFVCSLYYCL